MARSQNSAQDTIRTAAQMIGITVLKPKQVEAIGAFISGKDVFVSLPTGYGKSAIYSVLPGTFDLLRGTCGIHHLHRIVPHLRHITNFQLFSLSFEGKAKSSIVVCVCPLSSIMMDQKAKFAAKGISAEFVGEAQLEEAANRAVVEGKVQLVYISPENLLLNPRFRGMLTSSVYKEHLCAFVVDEAHCVKSW